MNNNLECLNKSVIEDNFKEKLFTIEDIIKARRLLYGFGFNEHLKTVLHPENDFDELYELDLDSLILILATHHAVMSAKAREMAGFKDNETTHNQ